MSGYPLVLMLAALPALGNFAGAVLAEAFDVSERALAPRRLSSRAPPACQ